MAHYEYILREGGDTTLHYGGAQSDAAARREAVLFMSEVMRDMAAAETAGLSVLARHTSGRIICLVEVSIR